MPMTVEADGPSEGFHQEGQNKLLQLVEQLFILGA